MNITEMPYKEALEAVLEVQQSEKLKNRVFGSLKLQVIDCDNEKKSWADFRYEAQEQYLNPYDGVHGGMSCVIGDSCMGTAICAACAGLPSTTDMSVSYHSPMPVSNYRIHVEIKKIGAQLAGTTCDIFDENSGKLCVSLMAKYILVRKDILADKKASEMMR